MIAQHPDNEVCGLVREPRNPVRAKSAWVSASDWNPCPRYPGTRSLVVSADGTQVKIEISPVLRGVVKDPNVMPVAEAVEDA